MKNVIQILLTLCCMYSTTIVIGQNYVQGIDHMHIAGLSSPQLETTASELAQTIITDDPNNPFKVLSYNIMPSLAYAKEPCYDGMKEYVNTLLEAEDSYLALIKTIETSEETSTPFLQIEVKFKLPNAYPYDTLGSIFLDGLQVRLERIANEEFNISGNSIAAEINIMNTFSDFISNPQYLDFNTALDELGFLNIPLTSNISIEGVAPSQNSSDLVKREIVITEDNIPFNLSEEIPSTINLFDKINLDLDLIIASSSNNEQDISFCMQEFRTKEYALFFFLDEEADKLYTNAHVDEDIANIIVDEMLVDLWSKMGYSIEGFRNDPNVVRTSEWNIAETWMNEQNFAAGPDAFAIGIGCGVVDGFIGSIKMLYDMTKASANLAKGFWETIKAEIKIFATVSSPITASLGASIYKHRFNRFVQNSVKTIEEAWGIIQNLINGGFKQLMDSVMQSLNTFFSGLLNGEASAAYTVGVLLFDIIFGIMTAGIANSAKGAKFAKKLVTWLKESKFTKIGDFIGSRAKKAEVDPKFGSKVTTCKVLGSGCFVRDTPVLIAGNRTIFDDSQNEGPQATFERDMRGQKIFNLKQGAKAMAVAASLPIVAVPIQDVQLLDYAVAHKTVNSTYGLTASADDDIYLGLMDKDPYTSDQQRERDQYELDDENWNEVVFEQINGNTIARLALHNNWINQKGYQVDAVVNLNLPEQGINGQFRITSIKHIIPQKKPVEEDETDDYDYQPVTALFSHISDQVYTISFDNGEEVGVTYHHPIYSTTAGEWKSAGELEVGESVLAKNGNVTVTKSTKKERGEAVYNIEVRQLHNFLVGEVGILVHNSCFNIVSKRLKKLGIGGSHRPPPRKKSIKGSKANDVKDKNDHYKNNRRDKDGNIEVCYDDLGFPDFNEWVPKITKSDGTEMALEFIIDMNGNHSNTKGKGDYGQVFDQMESLLGYRPKELKDIKIPGYDNIPGKDDIIWTLHHHQDGKTMQLVPRLINDGASHVGGAKIVEKGGKHNFPGPEKTNLYKKNCN